MDELLRSERTSPPAAVTWYETNGVAAEMTPLTVAPCVADTEQALVVRRRSSVKSEGAGVRLLSTPGHSPGHQSLVFYTNDGPVALAGQAIYSKAEYEHLQHDGTVSDDDPPPDPTRYLASAARLRDLRPRRVHFSHDSAVWERSP